jgi:hypothetical protein
VPPPPGLPFSPIFNYDPDLPLFHSRAVRAVPPGHPALKEIVELYPPFSNINIRNFCAINCNAFPDGKLSASASSLQALPSRPRPHSGFMHYVTLHRCRTDVSSFLRLIPVMFMISLSCYSLRNTCPENAWWERDR